MVGWLSGVSAWWGAAGGGAGRGGSGAQRRDGGRLDALLPSVKRGPGRERLGPVQISTNVVCSNLLEADEATRGRREGQPLAACGAGGAAAASHSARCCASPAARLRPAAALNSSPALLQPPGRGIRVAVARTAGSGPLANPARRTRSRQRRHVRQLAAPKRQHLNHRARHVIVYLRTPVPTSHKHNMQLPARMRQRERSAATWPHGTDTSC
jgi:hypothetical protein